MNSINAHATIIHMANRLRKTVQLGLALAITTGLLVSVLTAPSCQRDYSGPVESIVVAWSPFEQNALLWIAENENFFNQNGLDVTLRKYDTGVGSLDGMLNGEADITVGVTEFPIVGRAFQKSRARIIGAAAKIEQQYLVGRKDRGIEKVSDLKGKRIGTTLRTIAEFYLGRFLELNGMNMQEIAMVDLRTPAEWEHAVADGVVDAIVTAQPFADLARKRLGNNAIVWPAQGGQYIFGLIVSSEEWITKHPDVAGRFLKSLAQAEEYAIRNSDNAKVLMQKWLNVDAAFVDSAWSRDQFNLSLDQSLITAMEDEARWMIRNNLTTEKQVPNFTDYIHEDTLKAVKPGAVNIIR
ncbi:MAG: NrtA/SsuA/CpmA family ABC transporter substrate-binding protein [Chloroflexi bacterium]|nr:NrtA/SsuA/CpmA family ABC transporter substrate-binding protein [Chloroflexota bacterium]